ncbi:MAG: hypothetical protein SPL15_01010 [Lachnospiraceae bacterium]|nr:hypothetical protein [Lachnospiraceae bacterium]MDY5741568.1 hypothetical protein [Lachnospiraceae bacterium]
MIHEKKVKAMTDLAIYEKHHSEECRQARMYFKKDYISVEMIKSGLLLTMVYLIFAVIWMLAKVLLASREFHLIVVTDALLKLVIGYIVLLVVYEIIIYYKQFFRYDRSRAAAKTYLEKIKRVEACQEEE